MTDRKHPSREEDFRDYEERDIRDGWPYSDNDDGRKAGGNAPYGAGGAELDQIDNERLAVTSDPEERAVAGAPTPFSDEEGGTISDDDLEARIMEALEDDGRVELDMLQITIRDGVAELDGAVDSEDDRNHLIRFVRGVKGVRDVAAEGLATRGIDSHIAADSTE
ncbi:BON domain-containing protein [Shinella oryzae]|uniref:BON domain-containing protein n=1 Tax=Shinella oryzae TaxID=2871820 RepID=A0ABY9KDN2_9HYPH|nr:BON domain-containing protein [Shinella oryzae]UPA26401.1 BON domain-containing protein [Shinella oryzae]WLS05746.1 BON domain-containing protein [Shinella oryzae]